MTINVHCLFTSLKTSKPKGWSVVKRASDILVRPSRFDRPLGKFVVTPPTILPGECTVMFFSQRYLIWKESISRTLRTNSDAEASELLVYMAQVVETYRKAREQAANGP